MTPRFFCPFPLSAGATVQLPAETAHHAVNVLKVGAGDTAILFDGRGGQWRATLAMNGKPPKAALMATLETFDAQDNESPLDITLVQALPAGDKMDWVVQKAVELGVARIQPVMARRSVVKLSGERAERRVAHWRSIAIAACEQSGRNRVPEVAPIVELPRYLGQLPATSAGLRLICAPGACASLRDRATPAQAVTLCVGPESGFDDSELSAATTVGFQPIRLGPRILRTETAGLAALAVLMALWGDL
ncbi:MAG: 16S rRNA (uracil(1498)-N(3))-methyltransferase [Rugosibacter sp.]|jgi:16S rRNA (uracil1498-N3)-methyltransferase|nr:16S rRNA (uracil1498-N3)-methyltransferase [Rugosibacter sp.]